jgi:hypothetical protein
MRSRQAGVHPSYRARRRRRRDEREYTDCPYFANKKVLPSQLFFV